jgi:hypothetical protein
MQPTMISGFSDDVELGEIGEIKKNSTVVMRVTVDGGPSAAPGVHWRGVALTKFDGKRWFNDPHEPTTLTSPADGGWFRLSPAGVHSPRSGRPVHYTVLLEPIGSTALFFANEAETVRGHFTDDAGRPPFSQRRMYLLQDFTGSIFNPYHNYARMEYEANSFLPMPPPAAVREAGTNYEGSIRETYLQLPTVDPRIPELARQITARDNTPFDKARSIEAYLRSHYGYTLDLSGPPQSDPLPYFLFQKRAGHCEYFATAMTVMLRTLDIPARYINGFQTGEYNDVAGDLVVRESDAHSWVEVYFPGFGWLTFDPTPPTDEKPPGMFAQIMHYWDWFELQWSEWVINYDILHQFTLAQNLQRVSRSWTERLQAAFTDARLAAAKRLERWQSRIIHAPAALPASLAIFAALFVFVLLLQPGVRQRLMILWHLRISPAAAMTPHVATLHYNEMLRLLARRGIRKSPGQTPQEFATSLPDGILAEPVHELTGMYQASRFGGRTTDSKQASTLLTLIQSLLRSR